MAGAEDGAKFDHVVSVMFENRTFDNLLGRLCQPGEVASFEGPAGRDLSDPIPDWAEQGADRRVVPYGVAANLDNPDHVAGLDPKTATSERALDYLNDRAARLYPGLAPRPT